MRHWIGIAEGVWAAYSRAIRARPPDNPSPHSPSASGMTKAIPPSFRVRIGRKPPFLPRPAPCQLAICTPFGRKNHFQATPGMPERQSFGSRMNICTRRVIWGLDEYLHQTRQTCINGLFDIHSISNSYRKRGNNVSPA